MKTPVPGGSPSAGVVKASPPNGKIASSPSVTPTPVNQVGNPKVVMQSPSQPPKAQAPSATPAGKPVTVAQKMSPAASPAAGVMKASVALSTVSTTGQSAATAATTVASGTKTAIQGQAANQALPASTLTNQGLTLLRAPVQLPPGVQATMITNAQGIPVMRLQGAGIQGTAPVTLVTSQVGATQLQGATIVRMATPIAGAAAAGTTTGTVLRLPVQSGGTSVQGTAVLKIPVTSSIQMPGAAGLTFTAMAGTTGQAAVIKQQLPVTVPTNLPPGTQLKVGPQGQLTAVGPGGIPVQLTLQNVKGQVAQGATLTTPTVLQLAGSSPVKVTNTSQLVSSSISPQKVTSSTQSSTAVGRLPITTTTVVTSSKTVVTATASATPSAAVAEKIVAVSKVTSSPVVSSTSGPTSAQASKGLEQKTLATASATQNLTMGNLPISKQVTPVSTQAGKVTVVASSSASGIVTTAVSAATITSSPIKARALTTVASRGTVASTAVTSSVQPVKTTVSVSATVPKPATPTVIATVTTPTPVLSAASVARVTSAQSTAPSTSTQLSRTASVSTAGLVKSTAGIVKATAVTGTPVVSAVSTPLVSTSVSSSTPVAVVSPLVSSTRPGATVAAASPAKMTTTSPATASSKPSQVSSAFTPTVNGGVGATTYRSATPTTITKVLLP